MAGHLAKLGFWALTCLSIERVLSTAVEFFEHKVSHALAAASAGEVSALCFGVVKCLVLVAFAKFPHRLEC